MGFLAKIWAMLVYGPEQVREFEEQYRGPKRRKPATRRKVHLSKRRRR